MNNKDIEFGLFFLCCCFFISDIILIYNLCMIRRLNQQRYQEKSLQRKGQNSNNQKLEENKEE